MEAQLKKFRAQTRGDPAAQAYMWAMASRLDDQTIADLAGFYAAQKPAAGVPGDAMLMTEGKSIYENGIAEQKVLGWCTSNRCCAQTRPLCTRPWART